jgi:hypothetical protein
VVGVARRSRDFVVSKRNQFLVQTHKDQVFDKEKAAARRKLDTRVLEYLVHADRTIHAILQLQRMFLLLFLNSFNRTWSPSSKDDDD